MNQAILPLWHDYSENSKSALPHEFFPDFAQWKLNVDGPEHESWVLAAAKQNLPLFLFPAGKIRRLETFSHPMLYIRTSTLQQ